MRSYAQQSSNQTQTATSQATESLVDQPYGNMASADYLFGGPGTESPAVDVPARRPGRDPSGEGDGYRNQLDNDTLEGVAGSAQCLLTSATMVVLAFLGDTFADMACIKLAEVGLPCRRSDIKGMEPEMIIQEWAAARDWSDEQPGRDFDSIRFTQSCAEITVEEWTDVQLTPAQGGDLRSRIEGIAPLPAVISTNLTGSGHVVTLRSVDASGIVVHDPNGAFLDRQSQYLRNGAASTTEAPPSHRWAEAPYLREAHDAGEARDDWGRNNRFTWDEVEAHDIGKWGLTGA